MKKPSNKSQTLEVIVKAKELLEKGWCKNAFAITKSGDGITERRSLSCASEESLTSYCLLGALYKAIPTGEIGTSLEIKLTDTVGYLIGIPGVDSGRSLRALISEWNDEEDRRKEEVIYLLDKLYENFKARV